MLRAQASTGVARPILDSRQAGCCQATDNPLLKPAQLVLDWAKEKIWNLRWEMRKMREIKSTLRETQRSILITWWWQSAMEQSVGETGPRGTWLVGSTGQQSRLSHWQQWVLGHCPMHTLQLLHSWWGLVICEKWTSIAFSARAKKLTFTSLEGPGKAHVKDL